MCLLRFSYVLLDGAKNKNAETFSGIYNKFHSADAHLPTDGSFERHLVKLLHS